MELDVEKVREPCSDQQISHGLSIGSFEQHKRLMAWVKMYVQKHFHTQLLSKLRQLCIRFLSELPNRFVRERARIRRVASYRSILGHRFTP